MDDVKKAIAVLEAEKLLCERYSEKYMAIELAIKSLEMQYKMMEHCEGSCTGCSYYNSTFGEECMNDFIIDVGELTYYYEKNMSNENNTNLTEMIREIHD